MKDHLRDKYLWLTDTHLWPHNRFKMLNVILDEKPKGVFLTGDISNSGPTLLSDLEFLGKRIGRPLYFTCGNHDYWLSDFKTINNKIRELCKQYKNLIWIDDQEPISLNEEVALIGEMGWYDARVGNPDYLKYTFDWFMIKDFRELSSMKHRIEMFRELAEKSAKKVCKKLEVAMETHKTVYLLLHMPCWKEANRSNSFLEEAFWTPYNTNYIMGKELETVMEKHKKRSLVVRAGHCHSAISIHISRNIECHVGKGSYHKISDAEIIYI